MSSPPDRPTESLASHSDEPPLPASPSSAPVTVRYWAGARAAAGRTHDEVPAGTLNEVLAAVLARHRDRPRLAEVVAVCSILVGEDPVGDRDRDELAVPPGTSVELLPPFAGG